MDEQGDERGAQQGSEPVEELALEPVAVVRQARPRALWAVLAAVGLTAGAVVVTSTDDAGNERPGLPVHLAGAARMAGGDEAAADSSMLAWVTYVPGDELPALGGEATAYRLHGNVDEDQVRRLADALGLDGPVDPGPDGTWSVSGQAGGGRLDVYTGGGAYWSYASAWDCRSGAEDLATCSGDAAASSPGSAATVTCDSDLPSSPECTVTTVATVVAGTAEPAPDLPSEEDARQIALDLVAASGANVDGARVTADHGNSWFVTVEPLLEGIPSGQLSYVEVGSRGEVVSANGTIGQAEAVGEYPLVDTRAAIHRANEPSGTNLGIEPAPGDPGGAGGGTTGAAGGTDQAAPPTTIADVADPVPGTNPCKVQPDGSEVCEIEKCPSETVTSVDDLVATTVCAGTVCPPYVPDSGTSSSTAEEGSAKEGATTRPPDNLIECPPADPGVDPVPDPIPEPQPLEVVLVDAEPSLVTLPANDGTPDIYLVPAYRFTAEDGSNVDLPAIADEALTAPDTTDTAPATDPPEPVPLPEPVPVPEPQPCQVLEEQDATGTTHTMQSCPTPDEPRPRVGAHHVDALVMDEHCTWLVVKLDGRVWWTPDYHQDDLHGWSQPTEAGTFTIHEDGSAEFVADADPKRVATLVPWEQDPEGPLCA